ncbi:uncharacterized protein LOC125254016 isoform X1 [Megalobrama amblycephala]|uniref:uncharacterized protein LOC125254016 isoform X1 n=1 Tax=Megalobrama amblycephala TaxID=75352 RepID=UPI0020141346|nr:uncharacterized protein LOC125254016 isoform X1 [Megalobrama amblycephala]
MRNHSFLVLVLLLVVGVFGVDTDGVKSVSVMEGDSVTLLTGLTEIQTDEVLRWTIQDDTIIAETDGEDKAISVPGNEESFQGRLKLDPKTGSLTITNIKTRDSGVYKLKISGKKLAESEFSVTVRGVFGVTDGVKSVSVMLGDSVTLHTDLTEIQTNYQILWRFGGDIIPRLNSADYKWSNIDLNSKNGDLNIRNIQNDQAGVYELEINNGSVILHRKLRITFSGVFSDDGVKKMSASKDESVTLQTRIIYKPEDDVIEWTFGSQDTALAKTDRQNDKIIIIYNEDDVRFKDRLELKTQSGDLTVNYFNTEVSGLYKVKIIKKTYTLQKTFDVGLKDSQERSGSTGTGVSVKCGASVVLACAAAVLLLQGV